MGRVAALCPSCSMREADTPSGFCAVCVLERAAVAYAQSDRERAETRSAQWRRRSSSPDARLVLMRQHRHRSIERIRPQAPLAVFDPWDIAAGALERCRAIARGNTALRRDMDAVSEALRRLAWGPDDGTPWPTTRRIRKEIPGQMALFELMEAVAA